MEHGRNNQQQDQQQPPPPQQQRRVKAPEMAANTNQNHHQPHHQPPPPQKCPRCDSSNTKFCYYNNYSLSQPRYFCKACRRYWTQGGTLRNVPVGGGCRKSKRPKPANPSSSAAGETSRTGQSLPPAAAMITGQVRALPPQMMPPPSMGGGSLFGGGAFLSSLAAMQSLPGGINQGPPATANLGGAASQFGANMALLQGLNLPPFKPPAPENLFPPQNESFSSQQRPPVSSWTQSFINRGGATSSSAAGHSFWSGAPAESGDNQAASSSSFNPNYWPADNHPGFDPPQ